MRFSPSIVAWTVATMLCASPAVTHAAGAKPDSSARDTTSAHGTIEQLLHDRAEFAPVEPNPARGHTELRYSIAKPGAVDLAIYDITGRRVRTLLHGPRHAGRDTVIWDGRGDTGLRMPNGVYFARLAAPGTLPRVQRIALMR